MTLTKFLLARLDEDEATAGRIECVCAEDSPTEWQAGCPDRVLAEVDAKRRIVARCSEVGVGMPSYYLAQGMLSELALPYADHPDYDEAWRP